MHGGEVERDLVAEDPLYEVLVALRRTGPVLRARLTAEALADFHAELRDVAAREDGVLSFGGETFRADTVRGYEVRLIWCCIFRG